MTATSDLYVPSDHDDTATTCVCIHMCKRSGKIDCTAHALQICKLSTSDCRLVHNKHRPECILVKLEKALHLEAKTVHLHLCGTTGSQITSVTAQLYLPVHMCRVLASVTFITAPQAGNNCKPTDDAL